MHPTVIYQIFLRSFTAAGTIEAATGKLEHLTNLGVDTIYLCPHTVADDDPDRNFWSVRHKKSGVDNPCSPYRLKDYFRTDPEYGTDNDLKAFINQAHALRMRVILDLVYYHCGPSATILQIDPSFVKRNPDGSVSIGDWLIPELNFDNPSLRRYLYTNMEYFVREFDVDGFRCDAEDHIPLDFWEEGRRRINHLKPNLFMLAESQRTAGQPIVYDANYAFQWSTRVQEALQGQADAASLRKYRDQLIADAPPNARYVFALDNHDIANDAYEQRAERQLGHRAMDVGYFLTFMLEGIPFLYNGNEIADSTRHSIFASRRANRALHIDWDQASTPAAQARLSLIRQLIALRRSHPELRGGQRLWLKTDNTATLAFMRRIDAQCTVGIANLHNHQASTFISLPPNSSSLQPLLSEGAEFTRHGDQLHLTLQPYGFLCLASK